MNTLQLVTVNDVFKLDKKLQNIFITCFSKGWQKKMCVYNFVLYKDGNNKICVYGYLRIKLLWIIGIHEYLWIHTH